MVVSTVLPPPAIQESTLHKYRKYQNTGRRPVKRGRAPIFLTPSMLKNKRCLHIAEYPAAIPPLLKQGKIRFRITSNSMRPALKPGDLVEIKDRKRGQVTQSHGCSDLSPFPVLVVKRNGALICHRLARMFTDETGRRCVVTRAEKAKSEDPPVPIEDVVGEVTRVLRPRLFHRLAWRLRRFAGTLLRGPLKMIYRRRGKLYRT